MFENDENDWYQTAFGRFLIFFTIFAAVMAFVLGPGKKVFGQTQEVQGVRDLYNQGFELVMRGVPDFVPEQDKPNVIQVGSERMLSLLKTFKINSTRWAYVEKGAYVAMQGGHKDDAWLAVVLKGDKFFEKNPPFIIEESPDVNALRIKAFPVSQAWAGIFLTHELSHLLDRALSWQARVPTRRQYLEGEVRAYAAEISLVNRLTSNQFGVRLKQVLAEKNLAHQSQVANFIKRKANMESVQRMLEPLIGGLPAGEDEQALRYGFYAVALCLEATKNNMKPGDGGRERLAAEAAIIERLMIETGMNRFLPPQ